ncbi:MAG: right-handed parallel beta-helix repeat-containing protein [Holophaga sp.]|jgi:hypothetical protein
MRFPLPRRSAALLLACAASVPLCAQATRTWVSGVGDDANPCSRTAPCKTFAGAISKTAAQGEIDVLDPGGFGGITITKSITLDGTGTMGGVLVSGTNGITVAAGVNDVVILRNLVLKSISGGLSGIQIDSAGLVVVEHCVISEFTVCGVNVFSTAFPGKLVMTDVTINGGPTLSSTTTGVRVAAGTGSYTASLDQVTIAGMGTGIDVFAGTLAVNRSLIAHNGGAGVKADGGTVSVVNSTLRYNVGAALQSASGTLRASNDDIFDNGATFVGTGTLVSGGNNRTGGNGTGVAPPATLPAF